MICERFAMLIRRRKRGWKRRTLDVVGPSVSTYIEVAEARYGVGPATEPATEGRSGATAGLAAAASGLSARLGSPRVQERSASRLKHHPSKPRVNSKRQLWFRVLPAL